MRILSVQLFRFRCFNSYKIAFNNTISLIIGNNGIGKTSLLEALHFACYMRSFKTHVPRELIDLNTDPTQSTGFALKITVERPDSGLNHNTLNTTYLPQATRAKKTIKLDGHSIKSYKELYDIYKVITITEDDLMLVQGNPGERRNFIDQIISLIEPSYISVLKKYRHILNQRNALFGFNQFNLENYLLWSEQLYNITDIIQKKRIYYLDLIEKQTNSLAHPLFESDRPITLQYQPARSFKNTKFEDAFSQDLLLKNQEIRQKRSLFGAHLDDYTITFQNKSSRIYASRGQQKLIVFLLKGAQLKLLNTKAILLIDDFMTDLDEQRINALIPLMSSLTSHLIITSPLHKSEIITAIKKQNGEIITIL